MKWPEGIAVGEVTRLAQPPSRPALRLLSGSLPLSPAEELQSEEPFDERKPGNGKLRVRRLHEDGPHEGKLSRQELLGKGLRTGRELLRARRDEDAGPPLATAVDAFDRLLDGGIPRGQLVEVFGHRGSGRFSVVLGTLAAVTGTGEAAALVDLGDGLDPSSAQRAGVDLARLLWLRPRRLKDALHGAEMLLTAGFPLVIVDLGNPPLKGSFRLANAWLRLARTAHKQQAALLVASPYRISGAAASVVLQALRGRPRWSGRGATLPLLEGLEGRWELKKCRGRRPGERQPLHLATEPPPRLAAEPADSGTSNRGKVAIHQGKGLRVAAG